MLYIFPFYLLLFFFTKCVFMRICVNIQKAPPLSSTLYTAIAQRLPPGQYSNNPFCQHVTNVAEMRRMEAIVDNSAVIEPYDDRWQNINNEFIQKYAMSRSGITVLHILSFQFYLCRDALSQWPSILVFFLLLFFISILSKI